MEIPDSYQGREQTFLKHRVLEEYLTGWGHKLGSISRHGPVRLWYVDCFAGPWMQKDEELNDTSVAIGLKALNTAAETWRAKGFAVEVSAIFVRPRSASAPSTGCSPGPPRASCSSSARSPGWPDSVEARREDAAEARVLGAAAAVGDVAGDDDVVDRRGAQL